MIEWHNVTLRRLGLSRERVIALSGSPARQEVPPPTPPPAYANCQRLAETIAWTEEMHSVIVARALAGESAESIAALIGVSRECISKKIRPLGICLPKGRPRRAN